MAKFTHRHTVALIFIMPQLLITLVFFIWPACQALWQSLFFSDAFGIHHRFAGLVNFLDLFINAEYWQAVWVTFVLVVSITLLTMSLGLLLAVLVKQRGESQGIYKTLLLWPYAVAPAVAAILWRFLCHPNLGWLANGIDALGGDFNYINHAGQAMLVVVLAASWQQFSYNFLFYFTALLAIPKSLLESATLDGASPWQRFWQIIFPLLSPTTFFLLVMNMIYGFFETFGIIQVMTHGGPGNSTSNLIYKLYEDGFMAMDMGSAAAQSVILMLLVVGLTRLQFKFVEKKVHYR